MPVNLTRPVAEPVGPEARLYLKEEELDRAVELVFAATRQFWRAAEGPLEARGLGPAHYRSLAAIRRDEGLTVSALRVPGPNDKRQRLLQLTEAGRTAERDASAALRERLAHVFRMAGADAVSGARLVMAALAAEDSP
jgi:DNA-binding MarR family transcriptional regulator